MRQCDMRLDDNAPAKQGADPQQERRRLALVLVHGIHVGEIRGAEQGELCFKGAPIKKADREDGTCPAARHAQREQVDAGTRSASRR